MCGIAGFKAHCALWFWNGKTVVGKQAKGAMGSFGRITNLKELPSPAKLRAYVRKGMKFIEEKK